MSERPRGGEVKRPPRYAMQRILRCVDCNQHIDGGTIEASASVPSVPAMVKWCICWPCWKDRIEIVVKARNGGK